MTCAGIENGEPCRSPDVTHLVEFRNGMWNGGGVTVTRDYCARHAAKWIAAARREDDLVVVEYEVSA